jgi:hypothetical protein
VLKLDSFLETEDPGPTCFALERAAYRVSATAWTVPRIGVSRQRSKEQHSLMNSDAGRLGSVALVERRARVTLINASAKTPPLPSPQGGKHGSPPDNGGVPL